MENYYKILELDKNASEEMIEKAYKTLVKRYHPDLQNDDNKIIAEEKIKKINEAYSILSDKEKREVYDQQFNDNYISFQEYNSIINENIKLKNELNNIKNYYNTNNNNSYNNYNNIYNNLNNDLNKQNRQSNINANKFSNSSPHFKHLLQLIISLFSTFIIVFLIIHLPFMSDLFKLILNSNGIILIIVVIFIYIYISKK